MKRTLGLMMAILVLVGVLLGVHLWRLPHGELVIDFLNVGQGDAILITTPDQHRVLIDGGPEQIVLEEMGAVIPFLNKEIDLMILTHPHADHVMGLVPVLERYRVKAVLFTGLNYWSPIYDEFLREIREQELPLYVARSDQNWQLGEVEIDILFPFESMLGETIENVNNGSIVTRIIYRDHHILLTGDAEIEVEEELVEAYSDLLESELMKAGHHGSRTASSQELLDAVIPDVVVIQVGKENSFDHPHEETLEKLDSMDVEVRRNDLEGRVRVSY